MAARRKNVSDASSPRVPAAPDSAALDVTALAEGVLARTIRPRAADVRRLAEAVLAKDQKRAKKKKTKAEGKKAGGKKRKLSKIAGQKAAK